MADKPYIEAREVSPFGDAHEYSPLADPTSDMFDLPGYSDKRLERELAVRRGERPPPLDFRIQFVPMEDHKGSPDRRKLREYRARGYEILTKDKAEELGLKLDDSACEIVDNIVRNQENVALWAPREIAARDNAKLDYRNKLQQEEVQAKMEDAVEKMNREAGLKEGAGGSKAIFELGD